MAKYFRFETTNFQYEKEVEENEDYNGERRGIFRYYTSTRWIQKWLPIPVSNKLDITISTAKCYFTQRGYNKFVSTGECDYWKKNVAEGTEIFELEITDEDIVSAGLVIIYRDKYQIVVVPMSDLRNIRAAVLAGVVQERGFWFTHRINSKYVYASQLDQFIGDEEEDIKFLLIQAHSHFKTITAK